LRLLRLQSRNAQQMIAMPPKPHSEMKVGKRPPKKTKPVKKR